MTRKDFDARSKISSSYIIRRLKSWKSALEKAGIGYKYSGRSISKKMLIQKSRNLTDEQILDELRNISKHINSDIVTVCDVRKYSEIISEGIIRRRFGSFSVGLEKAGLKTSSQYRRKYYEEEYFENLLNVWTYYGRQPLLREMDLNPSKIKSGAYENRFGTWRIALKTFVDKMNNDSLSIGKIIENKKLKTMIPIIKNDNPDQHTRNIKLSDRYKILTRDNFKCVKCGASPASDPSCQLHIDHILPVSGGGKSTIDNYQTLCSKCNLGKSNNIY